MRKSHSPGHALAHFLRALILVSLLLGLLPAAAPGHARAQTCDDANCITPNPNGADFAPYAMVASTLADDGRTVRIEWITEREIFSAGFNIVVETDRGFVPVNDQLIPSRVIESLDPQSYSYTTAVDADAFYLEHVTIENERFRAGPFFVGERVGEAPQTEAIDWRAIRAASEAKAQASAEKSVAAIDRALDAVRGPQESMGAARVTQINGAIVNLLVKEEGIYRVRFEDIDNNGNGPDLRGVPIAYLALTNRGMPVRIHMVASGSSSAWEEGAYFEFVGEGIDTFYTDENIYVLQVNRSKAFRIFTNMRMPDLTETPAPYYRETIRFEENNTLALSSTGADPWAWQYRMVRPGFPVLYSASLPGIDAVASDGPPPQLTTEIWGGNNLNHHAIFAVNGTQLQDINFTGAVAATTQSPMPAGILQNGGNSVTWTLPGDSSAFNDTMGLEAVTIEYSREFVAQDGALAFEGDAGLFRVDGLTGDQVTVFSRYRHRLWVMETVSTAATPQGYSAAFYGWGDSAEYFVAAEAAIKTPVIKVGQVPVDIESGTADFVIIAHPDFLSGLQPLVAARSTPEFTVKVVNVLDVYAQYSDSIFDAQAIRDYIQHAIQAMGAEYILLVGGDVIDYRNYVYPDAVSFIPSLYAETYPGQNFMPVDPLYTDIDDDGTPDAAIGRFPVKTAQELAAMVSKTLDYTNQSRSALFAADFNDGVSFSDISNNDFIAELPAAWQTSRAYLQWTDENDQQQYSTIADEKQAILDAVNAGVGLVNYLGHGTPKQWNHSGLLRINDVGTLVNYTAPNANPTLVTQFACETAFYSHPTITPIASAWVLSATGGAAASVGAVSSTGLSANQSLGREFFARVATPGKSIGTALLEAKQAVALSDPDADVLLSVILLGDPTLTVEP